MNLMRQHGQVLIESLVIMALLALILVVIARVVVPLQWQQQQRIGTVAINDTIEFCNQQPELFERLRRVSSDGAPDRCVVTERIDRSNRAASTVDTVFLCKRLWSAAFSTSH